MNDTSLFIASEVVDLTVPAARAKRDTLAVRIDVLDKVKILDLLPDGIHLTTEQVATYFAVPVETIRSVVLDNRAEVASNGYRTLAAEELRSFKKLCGITTRARSMALFTRRTVLDVAMLLRDSPVARQVRTHLLDVEERAVAPKRNDEFDILRGMIDQLEESRREASEAKALAARSEALSAKTEARLDAIEGRHDWFAGLGYARLHNLNTSAVHLRKVGLKATGIAKQSGIEAVKVSHQIYGKVNSYPAWVWELAFAEVS
ncbi:hypothetical protein LQL77_06910 [Rhodococcus cerastii]|nr:hypothetical protein [Rhodococcus cerastii]